MPEDSPGRVEGVGFRGREAPLGTEVELAADPGLVGRWLPDDEVGGDVAALRAGWR